MIQPRGAIELGNDCGELHSKSPLVCPTARACDGFAPAVPPPRNPSCQGLDNQHSIAVEAAFDKPRQESFSCGVWKLVQRERGKDGGAALGERRWRRRQRRDRCPPPREPPTDGCQCR